MSGTINTVFGAIDGQVVTCIVAFVIAVFVDDLMGIVLAVKLGAFDLHKLGSFLVTQYGTHAALALLGILAAAYLAGNGDLAQVKAALIAALTVGSGAITLGVVKDIVLKIAAIVGVAQPPAKPPAAATA